MVSKKSSRPPVSKISSAASPAVSSHTQSAQKSAVIRSAFSPSEFQLALFASVIQGLDSQHLRVHDTNTGRLRCDRAIGSKATVNSLDWGYFGRKPSDPHQQQNKKKRKRNEEINGVVPAEDGQDIVVAMATSESDIRMFSPAENKVLGTLQGGHDRGVREFKFTLQKPCVEGWSIGGDGKLVQWDLRRSRSLRTFDLPSHALSALARPLPASPRVLCASQTPYIVDVKSDGADSVISLNSHRNPIHTLISSTELSSTSADLFLAADSDRYINVFNIKDQRLLGNLIADNAVERLAFYPANSSDLAVQSSSEDSVKKEFLATVNEDGVVEIFSNPLRHFLQDHSTPSTSLKAQRKKMTKKADASIRVIRPDKTGTTVPVFDVSFQGPDIILARAEGGVQLEFERLRWADEETGELVLQGAKEIIKSKKSMGAASTNGIKPDKSHVDESHAVVVEGHGDDDIPMDDASQDLISISSGEVEDEDSSSPEAEGGNTESDSEEDRHFKPVSTTELMPIKSAENEEAASEAGEPSFGELLRAQTSEPIDVAAALSPQPRAVVPSGNTALQIPSGVSLATVLTQSLNTNDTNLLESCFHTTDTDIVRATIQRLEPTLSSVLLQRLAERLSSRPGRYGHLLVWIQWVCVAHGGYIAGNPDVLRKVSSLFRVLDQRCASLDSLLLLKGKLDMLDAQMGLRKRIQESGRGGLGQDDDDEAVIYVEGQEESSSSDDEGEGPGAIKRGAAAKLDADSEDDEDEDMPLTVNGVAPESDDEDEESEEGDAELVDDEAEETDDDSDDESIEDEEEDDDEGSEEEIDEFEDAMSEDDEEVEVEDVAEAVLSKKQKPTPRKARGSGGFVRG